MRVLVTGGAGYIGSHTVRQLGEAGHEVVVLDDLSTGNDWAVLGGELVVGDFGSRELVRSLFAKHRFEAVVHFAAHIVVDESVRDPLKYYRNNTSNLVTFLQAIADYAVSSSASSFGPALPAFVFSSTAAVYGAPEGGVCPEEASPSPINPYGASKWMSERILSDFSAASGMRYVTLRYFNVAGADPEARIGQATSEATHLIKVAAQAAVGLRGGVTVFGNDYDTPDGTCVRDYIHVEDLSRAHLCALDYLVAGGESNTLNCGYGRGYSVFEVLEAVKEESGVDFPVEIGERRPGDPPVLIASAEKAKSILGWEHRYDDLRFIVATALRFERKLAASA